VSTEADPEDPTAEAAERPSKSARKRAAHAAQDLGEELVRLREAQLEALDLPEKLKEAVRVARRITSRAGGARQRQYIGKLMRDIDLTRVREALGAKAAKSAQEAQRFQRIEAWRARLLDGGPEALAGLRTAFPSLDEAQWQQRVTAARAERERTGAVGGASRELFRALRDLLQ
jgi:ribosome-associated protein